MHLMGRDENWEDGMSDWLGQVWVVPDDNATLRSTECFARGTGHHRRAFAQWILELTTRNQANLMCAVKENLAAHSATISLISCNGNGNKVIDAPSATSFGRTSGAILRNTSRSTISSSGSIGTSTIFNPRTPAGPSMRLLECPPNG